MNVPLGLTRMLGHTEVYFKKNGPTILTAAGLAGFAATTYLVGKATLKSQPYVLQLKLDTEMVRDRKDPGWDDKKKQQAVGRIWINGSKQLLRNYAPAIVVGGASVACILTSHGMLQRQRAGLIAAYAALDGSFRAYRERVRSVVGEEQEAGIYRERYRRTRTEEDPETGKPCIINEVNPRIKAGSLYGRFFDASSPKWVKTPEYNKAFLKSQEQYANDRLKAYGYLFLNEVYEALGFERTQFGQVVGWSLSEDSEGDGFVSFGLDWISDEMSRAFTNGIESVVFLDFNVDGPIQID